MQQLPNDLITFDMRSVWEQEFGRCRSSGGMALEGSKAREGKHKMGAVACMLGIRRRFSGVRWFQLVVVGCYAQYRIYSFTRVGAQALTQSPWDLCLNQVFGPCTSHVTLKATLVSFISTLSIRYHLLTRSIG